MSSPCPPSPDIGPNLVTVLLALIAALGSIYAGIKSHQASAKLDERGL